jgi:cysteine-rich secretory family protein
MHNGENIRPRRNHMSLTSQDQQDIVAAHNVYRSDPAINTPPLQWSSDLATSAQSWADHLASTSTFEHSGTPGVGENIAEGSTGNFTPAQMVDFWGNEIANFQPGTFPNISTTGNWSDAGHYTQVIWSTTTSVGCGLASDGTNDYLVCQYSPPGNMEGVNVP